MAERFDTLVGDPGKECRRNKLPVDAYFPGVNLIVEYRETQHYKLLRLWINDDSKGVYRDEQRKNYDHVNSNGRKTIIFCFL